MGIKNYVIDGVSCAGKTTVCNELKRRGYQAIHGDDELAYWGDPVTGAPVHRDSEEPRTWLWNLERVTALVADQTHAATFLCGGCRNSDSFIDLLDGAFVLEIDEETLNQRLASRPDTEWGGTAAEGAAFARRQHATREGFPRNAVSVDAAGSLSSIVDTILEKTGQI